MEFFIDSIDVNEIRKYNSYGIIEGVTTNPSLMASTDSTFYETISEIIFNIIGDVSIEVISNDYEGMIKEGEKLIEISNNIVIKLPVTWDGIKACKYFSSRRKKTNLTLCFSANQALVAAKAGATYISPFVGRLDDIGKSGMNLISDIRTIYDNFNFETKILAASIRSLEHVTQVALCGADVITMPPKIIATLLDHNLTSSGLKNFNADWAKAGIKF